MCFLGFTRSARSIYQKNKQLYLTVQFFMCDPNQRHFLLLIICATSDSFLPAEYAMLGDSHSGTRQLSGSMLPLCGSGLLCGGHCTLACCARQATVMGCNSLLPRRCAHGSSALCSVCQAAPRARPSNSPHSPNLV